MCGLFGIAGPGIIQRDLGVLSALMVFNVLRGADSTGVFRAGYNGKNQKIRKEAISSPSFLKKYKTDVFDAATYMTMGHTRDATVGSVTDKNAHPFLLSNIAGCHNGTLVDSKYRGQRGMTDSEAMFVDINDRGIKPVLEELDGSSAFAITVYERFSDRLHLVRNTKRPLHFGVHKTSNVFYWSSELEMLQLACSRVGVDADFYTVGSGYDLSFEIKDIRGGKKFWDSEDLSLNKPYEIKKPKTSYRSFKSSTSSSGPPWDIDESDRYTFGGQSWIWDPTTNTYKEEIEGSEELAVCCVCDEQIPDETSEGVEMIEVEGVKYYTCVDCTTNINKEALEDSEVSDGSVSENPTDAVSVQH